MAASENRGSSQDRWVTRMGAWFPGERMVFRGRDLCDIEWLYEWL